MFDNYFFLRYATTPMMENMKKRGVEVVKNYLNVHKSDFSRVLETEKPFEFVLGDSLISGQIDLLKKVDKNGNVRAVEIVDFKNEKEEDTLYQRDYHLQLRLYAMACLESLGLSPETACIHHLDRTGKESLETVDISEPELKKAKAEVKQDIGNIIGGNLQAKPSAGCSKCDWGLICPNCPK